MTLNLGKWLANLFGKKEKSEDKPTLDGVFRRTRSGITEYSLRRSCELWEEIPAHHILKENDTGHIVTCFGERNNTYPIVQLWLSQEFMDGLEEEE